MEDVEGNGTDVTLRLVPRLTYGLTEDTNAPALLDANGETEAWHQDDAATSSSEALQRDGGEEEVGAIPQQV